ncbi:MAG: 30S ribosomal protein S6 [Candidatus Omnitrophica bacterium]|nr:30S ribosomal protein S6 [Candidatus Omnitrophota bacterium]
MNKYELAVVVDAALPQEQKDSIVKEASEAITKSGAKLINSQVWIEKHKFSFRMNKCWEGTYYLLNLESPTSAVLPLQKILRVNERILRFLMVRAAA